MKRYKAIVGYDGHLYAGWQRQNGKVTVQGAIEESLSRILNADTVIHASGRTDAGVHALGQVFHFDCGKELDLPKTLFSLNSLLPKDIRVSKLSKARSSFDARKSCTGKTYVYKINNGIPDPFFPHYVFQMNDPLDIALLQETADEFVGYHRFHNFTTKKTDLHDYYRTIYSFEVTKKKGLIVLEIKGDGFMRHMVRLIIGTMIAVNLGKEDRDFIGKKLDTETRETTHHKVPGSGLYLMKVDYGK